jgi:hypothetical protein
MCHPYYINEAGLKINSVTGALLDEPVLSGQCLPP